jgi:hypothetical protein
MGLPVGLPSNFGFLQQRDEQFVAQGCQRNLSDGNYRCELIFE